MSTKVDEKTSVDSTKRDFMVKAGKYAVVGAGMATLMTPGASTAGNYMRPKRIKGNNGWGNGDQPAPGNSLPHNNAENGGGYQKNHGNSIPD